MQIIVEIIIDLARKLRLKSVAEGVEDNAALKTLIGMGCDTAQGYYISRPIAPDLMPQFVANYEAALEKTAA